MGRLACLLSLAAAMACADARQASPAPAAPPAEALSCSSAPEPAGPVVPMPRPHRARLAAAVKADGACVSCHPDEAANWRG